VRGSEICGPLAFSVVEGHRSHPRADGHGSQPLPGLDSLAAERRAERRAFIADRTRSASAVADVARTGLVQSRGRALDSSGRSRGGDRPVGELVRTVPTRDARSGGRGEEGARDLLGRNRRRRPSWIGAEGRPSVPARRSAASRPAPRPCEQSRRHRATDDRSRRCARSNRARPRRRAARRSAPQLPATARAREPLTAARPAARVRLSRTPGTWTIARPRRSMKNDSGTPDSP